jgi:hypothetical protein
MSCGLRRNGNGRGLGSGSHRSGHDRGLERQHVEWAVLERQRNSQVANEGLACTVELRTWPIEAADNGSDIEKCTAPTGCRGVAEQQWKHSARDGGRGADVDRDQPTKGASSRHGPVLRLVDSKRIAIFDGTYRAAPVCGAYFFVQLR